MHTESDIILGISMHLPEERDRQSLRCALAGVRDPDMIPALLEQAAVTARFPWLPDLARLELATRQAGTTGIPQPGTLDSLTINPALRMVPVRWHGLPELLAGVSDSGAALHPAEEVVLVWHNGSGTDIRTQTAQPGQLLALKMVAEGITPENAAALHDAPQALFRAALYDATTEGLLLSPPSKIRRRYVDDSIRFAGSRPEVDVFTLQWHLTQTCDLSCKHCYDRSRRDPFPLERAYGLLQELCRFCDRHFVRPQVSLSGGNPLLHPHFFDIYQAAAEQGAMTAILGNAAERPTIERLVQIQQPVFYQVSLEGLEEHNDAIRGAGNFRRTVAFLRMLTELGVPNMVMLTLTRENLDQVLPLARYLEGIADGLTFNRLARFGEGAGLELPTKDEYRRFLEQYLAAAESSPVLACKDSLINIVLEQNNRPLFGGCTGYGCGAAFNFVAVLSDGEAHACRKFPSPIGNVHYQGLEEIYHSSLAEQYRNGSSSCSGCPLRAVCGGCPALTAGSGLNPFHDRDPYCFRTW